MTIEFKDLGNIESFSANMQEPDGYGAFDEDQNPEQHCMIGKRFQNVSGKTIQVPNRISGAFSWSPGERIDILDECKLLHTEGYLVHNIDYVGNYRAHETAWITKEILEQSFKEIIELCSCYYPVNTYIHTGSKICGSCKKLIPCYK